MNRGLLVLVVGTLLALPVAFGKEKGGNKGGERAPIMSLEAIEKKVGDLSDEQKTKITALRNQVLEKMAGLKEKEEVKAALEELANAKKEKDKEKMKAAAAKLKEVMGGFNPTVEFKKGLQDILTADQMAKLSGKGGKKGGAAEGDAKKEKKKKKKKDE